MTDSWLGSVTCSPASILRTSQLCWCWCWNLQLCRFFLSFPSQVLSRPTWRHVLETPHAPLLWIIPLSINQWETKLCRMASWVVSDEEPLIRVIRWQKPNNVNHCSKEATAKTLETWQLQPGRSWIWKRNRVGKCNGATAMQGPTPSHQKNMASKLEWVISPPSRRILKWKMQNNIKSTWDMHDDFTSECKINAQALIEHVLRVTAWCFIKPYTDSTLLATVNTKCPNQTRFGWGTLQSLFNTKYEQFTMFFRNKEFSNIGNKVLIPSGVQTACAGKQKHRSRLQASANTKKNASRARKQESIEIKRRTYLTYL